MIDLHDIKESERKFDFSIEPPEIDLESESAKLAAAARVSGKISKTIAQVNVEGEICAELEIECSRCLQPVKQKFEIPFRAAFVVPENYTQAKETELKTDELEVSVFEGDRIDLTELAREQILLAVPAQVFCAEDCKGLCQKCGANRNLINCNCEEKEIDPRWAALGELKIKN